MNKIKKPKLNEYVLVTKHSDKSPKDPWFCGHIDSIIKTENGYQYTVRESTIKWNHVFRLTEKEKPTIFCDYIRAERCG